MLRFKHSLINFSYVNLQNRTETPECFHGCQTSQVPIPDGEIKPSPTLVSTESSKHNEVEEDGDRGKGLEGNDEDFLEADRQYWIVTVLKSNGDDPMITDLKNSLVKLYKMAFQR